MPVAKTSRQAYDELRASGKQATQRARVLCTVLRMSNGVTRREIHVLTGMEIGAVCGRVNELIADRLLCEDGEVQCDVTKKTVKVVKPVIAAPQQGKLL